MNTVKEKIIELETEILKSKERLSEVKRQKYESMMKLRFIGKGLKREEKKEYEVFLSDIK